MQTRSFTRCLPLASMKKRCCAGFLLRRHTSRRPASASVTMPRAMPPIQITSLCPGSGHLVGAGPAAPLERPALQQNLGPGVQELAPRPDPPAWALVGAILGNLEPPSHLHEMLSRALSRVSFSRLVEQGLPVALTAIG